MSEANDNLSSLETACITLLRNVMLRMDLVSVPTIKIGSNLLRTWNGRYLHTTKEPIMNSAILAALSDDDLWRFHDYLLEQFALALLIGAHENSEWSNGKLVIDANHGPIHRLQVAFYAVRLEVQRRGGAVAAVG